jgi:hypothetical protein
MKSKSVCLMILLFLYTGTIAALAQNVEVNVGWNSIQIPVPYGFRDVSKVSPDTWKMIEVRTYGYYKLLSVFLLENDYDQISKGQQRLFERYIDVKKDRASEGEDISADSFAEIKTELKKYMSNFNQAAFESHIYRSHRAKDNLGEYGITDTYFLDKLTPLSVIAEGKNFISYAVKITTRQNDRRGSIPKVTSVNIIRVKNRLLFVDIHSAYRSQDDLDWLKGISKALADEIVKANPSIENINSSEEENDSLFEPAHAACLIFIAIFFISQFIEKKNTPSKYSTDNSDDNSGDGIHN